MLINILTSILAVFLVLATSILATHLIGLKSKVSSLLAFYIFSVANIILTTQIASLFSLLNNRWVVLAIHLLMSVLVLFLWKKHQSSQDLKTFLKWMFTLPAELKETLKKHPLYSILAAVILGATLFNAFIAIRVPPNTNDAMIQHMSRVGYWLQHGSMAAWNTPLVLQVAYPPIAQLQILWTILFAGADKFAPLIQWFAIPVSAIAIYGLSNRLGWSKEKSALTALLWMTLPQIVLQSTSTQNDLISSGLIVATLYFLYAGIKDQSKGDVLLSALTLTLAMGTKQTVFLILPALFIILVSFWWRASQKNRNLVYLWVVSALSFFLVFGAYIYIQNMVEFKTPFGPAEVVSETVSSEETGFFRNAVLKIGRITYQTFDLTEVPYRNYGYESRSMWLYNKTADLKAAVGSRVFSWLNIDLESGEGIVNYPYNSFSYIPPLQIQEDITWFGPMIFVMIPAVIVSLVIAIRKKDKYSIGLILVWLSLFLSINLFKSGWTPNQSRYYVLSVTCTMPLVSVLWSSGRKKFINILLLGFAILFMLFTILMNFCKPLIGDRSIWNKTDPELRGLQSETIRDSIVKIDDTLPENAVVGVALNGASFDYPLFGRHFSNRLIPAYPIDQINDQAWLDDNEICYVLVADNTDVEVDLSINKVIESSPGWTLYLVQNAVRCTP